MKVRLRRLGVLFIMSISIIACAITSSAIDMVKDQPSEKTASSEENVHEVVPFELDLIQRPMLMVSTPQNTEISIESIPETTTCVLEVTPENQETTVATETSKVEETTESAEEQIVETTEKPKEEIPEEPKWDGPVLNARNGTVKGPSGKETYYDLPMQGVIDIMESLGYVGDEWYFWIREDGVKMYGKYIMCAANLDIRPKGTIVETSLGTAMVCDTGGFAKHNTYQLDIATDWTNRNGY